MKSKILSVCVVVLTCLIFSQKSVAQRDAGGTASNGGAAGEGGYSGMECTTEPPPESFKRNNGGNEGNGTCGQDGQIRLKYKFDPSTAPLLVGLMYEDGSPVTRVYLPIEGDVSVLEKKHYVSYCLMGTNVIPAKKLIAVFRYPGGCQADIVLDEK